MKNILFLRFSLFLFVLLLANCKDPSEGVIVNVNTSSLFKAPFLVRFEKANPNAAAKIGDFKLTITGKDAALVQMGTGGTDFKVSQGNIPLALKSQATPTPAKPILFTINAEIPGYEPISKDVIITNDSALVYVIPAFDFINKVDGTSFLTTATPLKNGVITNALKLSTPTTSRLGETASVTIPAGTEIRDGSNRLIDADELRSTLIFYGNSAPAINAGLPNGTTTQNARDKNGTIIPFGINYAPIGIVRMDMFAGRSQVVYFSKPIEITQELPSGLVNYETNAPVKVGETLPLWTSSNIYWSYQLQPTTVTVVAGNAGKLMAKYTVNNTAVDNLSWGYSTAPRDINRSFELNFIPSHSPFTGGYSVQAINANNTYLFVMDNYQAQSQFQLGRLENNTTVFSTVQGKYGYSFPTTPNTTSMRVIVYSHQGKKVGESSQFNPLTTNSITLNIDNSPVITTPTQPTQPTGPPEYIKVSASFTGKCTNKNLTTPVNTWVTINDKTDNTSIFLYVKNGAIDNAAKSIQLIVGHNYNMSTTYDGQTYESSTFALTKADQVLKTGANNFSASFSYNASTNSLELSGIVTQECK